MNIAKPNEASSLDWLSVKRFCGEDAPVGGNLSKLTRPLGRRHISRSAGFIRRIYRGRWKWSVEDKNFE